MTRLVDLSGQRYGRLLVIGVSENPESNGKRRWFVRCDCGVEKEVRGDHLRSGRVISCGCRSRKHNDARPGKVAPEWHAWRALRARCYDKSNQQWERYGGRGITVCKGWRKSYRSFLAVMGRRPSSKHSIDRIENDFGYWCGACAECRKLRRVLNCRWATAKQQANNRTLPQNYTVGGVTLSVTEWARRIGVEPQAIFSRLGRGWDITRAVTTPIAVKVKLTASQVVQIRTRCAAGESQTSVARAFGVKRPTIASIVQRRNWPSVG